MPQIFPRWFDTVARAGIAGTFLLVPAVTLGAASFYRSDYVTGAGSALEQPVPFSHKHHVGQLGIDCRYCHDSAESSAFAGMPSTGTCMNCHQQMWVGAETLAPVRESWRTDKPLHWQRVHNLPGFVYFDHSAHVGKGVGCVVCHGRVDEMALTRQAEPLTMEWCVACHRDPGPRLRPKDEVYSTTWSASAIPDPLTGGTIAPRAAARRRMDENRVRDAATLTSCSVCHR